MIKILHSKVVLVALAFILFIATAHAESVYDRVMKSGKIRCAYTICPPGVVKDPNTGKLSGIVIDAMTKAAENLQLKAEFTEEVPWGSQIEGLMSDRYDVVLYVWVNSTRARSADFTIPLFYSGIGAYVRPNDTRFNNSIEAINDPSVKIATLEGEGSSMIAKSQFPKAKELAIPQLSGLNELLLNVSSGKADVTFVELSNAADYLKQNPNSVKNVALKKPINLFPNSVMFKRGEIEFKDMLDNAFAELLNSGYVEALNKKYESFPGAVYPVASPYQAPH